MRSKRKQKVLYILHHSPPVHGAAKVGDYVKASLELKTAFTNKYIKIKSSTSITNIGKFGFLKIWYGIQLVAEVSLMLFFFRPNKIYFTTSPSGFAFYRDFIIMTILKSYRWFRSCELFFHYHSSGVENFILRNPINKLATRFFVKGVNLVLISQYSKVDFKSIHSYKNIYFLNNGVKDSLGEVEFEEVLKQRILKNPIKVLYLSNMMKGKGYDIALDLAMRCNENHKGRFIFDFAGAWETEEDMTLFDAFVKSNKLENLINYHGLVEGNKKHKLYKDAHFFIFTSRLNEVFPLVLLEALSYGLPILAIEKGGVPEIVDKEVGMLTTKDKIGMDLEKFTTKYLNKSRYIACRERFLTAYQLSVFESNLKSILKEEEN